MSCFVLILKILLNEEKIFVKESVNKSRSE